MCERLIKIPTSTLKMRCASALKLWRILLAGGIVLYVPLHGAGIELIVLCSVVLVGIGLLGSRGFKYEKGGSID